MYAKAIATAAALVGWLLASVAAFVVVAIVDFLGVALIGVFIAFASSQVELETGKSAGTAYGAGMLPKQLEAERQMSVEQRASNRHELSLAVQSARFFKHFGLALAVIGFGGFAYRYL